MKYEAVVFDLDGTLVDSHKSIYSSTIKTLTELNHNADMDEARFRGMIGLHFRDIFKTFGCEVSDLEHFIEIYKGHYFNFIDQSFLYPGIIEMLTELNKKDLKIGLLTTKGQRQAEQIAEHFKFAEYFDLIKGWLPGEEIKPSAEPLLNICSKFGIDPEKTIMIGDAEIDVQCGINAGASTCAVTYGYRTSERLQQEKPDFIIDSVNEILTILNNNNKRE